MIPRAFKQRSCKKVPERNEKEWWGSSKNPEDGKTQKWFILIAIWMESIEHGTKGEQEKGTRNWTFLLSRFFLFKSQSCNNAVVVSTKLNRECNVLCFSKQKALCAFGCWWHMVSVLLHGIALFLLQQFVGRKERKLWMSVIHISFDGVENSEAKVVTLRLH